MIEIGPNLSQAIQLVFVMLALIGFAFFMTRM